MNWIKQHRFEIFSIIGLLIALIILVILDYRKSNTPYLVQCYQQGEIIWQDKTIYKPTFNDKKVSYRSQNNQKEIILRGLSCIYIPMEKI